MALNYRRGSAAIEDAATSKNGGQFRPFLPQITWKEDGESKYVLVLTDIEEVAELLLHQFIPVGRGKKANGEEFTRYEEFLSRKDPALGEDYDDLEDRLDRDPKTRCLGVMVELEPVVEGGSKKLKSFVVKTETFTRNTDDGEVEVTAPVIGLCTQSAVTMWGVINSTHQAVGDLTETPILITRRNKDKNTRYDVLPFMEKPVDLSPLLDLFDQISYLGDDVEDLGHTVNAEDSDVGKAQVIADHLLTKRIDELADAARYEELVTPLKAEDMPKNSWGRKQGSKGSSGAQSARQARPARRSPRQQTAEVETREEAPAGEKMAAFASLRARVEAANGD